MIKNNNNYKKFTTIYNILESSKRILFKAKILQILNKKYNTYNICEC